MSPMASQITASELFTQLFIQVQIKENINAPRHWPLCGEFTGDRWIPRTNASNAENVSIWWRHHGELQCVATVFLLAGTERYFRQSRISSWSRWCNYSLLNLFIAFSIDTNRKYMLVANNRIWSIMGHIFEYNATWFHNSYPSNLFSALDEWTVCFK